MSKQTYSMFGTSMDLDLDILSRIKTRTVSKITVSCTVRVYDPDNVSSNLKEIARDVFIDAMMDSLHAENKLKVMLMNDILELQTKGKVEVI